MAEAPARAGRLPVPGAVRAARGHAFARAAGPERGVHAGPVRGGRRARPRARRVRPRHEGRLREMRRLLRPVGLRGGRTPRCPARFTCRLARGRGRARRLLRTAPADLLPRAGAVRRRRSRCGGRSRVPDRLPATGGGQVVGVVRIWEEGPDLWWGGRLGVRPDLRPLAALGRSLVRAAVGTARAWGARQFRATVQRPNVRVFPAPALAIAGGDRSVRPAPPPDGGGARALPAGPRGPAREAWSAA